MADDFSDFGGDLSAGSSFGDITGSIGGLVSAGTSIFGGFASAAADEAAAKGYDIVAKYAQMNAFLSGESGGIKELALARSIQNLEGKEASAAAANGLKIGGSALSILKDSATQGALQEGELGLQTSINVMSYLSQSEAAKAQAEAARQAASAAEMGGILKGVGGLFGAIGGLFGLF